MLLSLAPQPSYLFQNLEKCVYTHFNLQLFKGLQNPYQSQVSGCRLQCEVTENTLF